MPNEFELRPGRDWWLTRWLKSESFWQGIVIQTLGTLAAATIVALIAIFSGVGYPPAIRYFVIFGFTIILYVGVTVILGVTFHIRYRWIHYGVDLIGGFADNSLCHSQLDRLHAKLTASNQPADFMQHVGFRHLQRHPALLCRLFYIFRQIHLLQYKTRRGDMAWSQP